MRYYALAKCNWNRISIQARIAGELSKLQVSKLVQLCPHPTSTQQTALFQYRRVISRIHNAENSNSPKLTIFLNMFLTCKVSTRKLHRLTCSLYSLLGHPSLRHPHCFHKYPWTLSIGNKVFLQWIMTTKTALMNKKTSKSRIALYLTLRKWSKSRDQRTSKLVETTIHSLAIPQS